MDILLHRFVWNKKDPHDPHYTGVLSRKLSIRLQWRPRDLWIGIYFEKYVTRGGSIYVCLIPCMPIRIRYAESYGGLFVKYSIFQEFKRSLVKQRG